MNQILSKAFIAGILKLWVVTQILAATAF